MTPPRPRTLVRVAAVALVLALGGLWTAAYALRAPGEGAADAFARLLAGRGGAPAAPPTAGGVALPPGATLGGPFDLVDHTGRAVTDADYRGRVALLFFGFTHCPDVCPTELASVAAALDELGPEASARVAPLFVTVDPERDTPGRLAEYVALFHPALVGLTGTPEQVARAARAYRVYYARATPAGASGYLVDHSAFAYLLGPDGRLRAVLRPGAAPSEIAAALRANLGGPAATPPAPAAS